MIKSIEENSIIEGIVKKFSQVGISASFPDQVFKDTNWQMVFFEAWHVFDENHFNHFIKLISVFKEKAFYIVNSDYSDKFYKLIECEADTEYKDFFRIVNDEFELTSAYNLFLFDASFKWVIYIDTFHDLMILGFDKTLTEMISHTFNSVPNKISTNQDLKDYLNKIGSTQDLDSFMSKVGNSFTIME